MTIAKEEQGHASETDEAMAMLGKGYDHPTVVIEPPRQTIGRKNGKLTETEEPAWVKFSTDFKAELKYFNVYALKVFIYVGLSINWKSGSAFPGIRKIAEDLDMDKGTVVGAVEWLESKEYMIVYRQEGKSNIYTPVRYFSIGTVRSDRTPTEELSGGNAKLSGENEELSGDSRVDLHNKNNKKEQEIPAYDFKNMTPKEAGKLPTLKLYKDATDFFPPSLTWEHVHNVITENDLTYDQIHNAAVAWALTSYRQNNIQGILEWAVNGIPEKHRPKKQAEEVPSTESRFYQAPEGDFVPMPAHLRPNIKRG